MVLFIGYIILSLFQTTKSRNFDEEHKNHLHFPEPVSLQEKLDVENTTKLLSTHKELEGETQDFQPFTGQGKVIADRTNDLYFVKIIPEAIKVNNEKPRNLDFAELRSKQKLDKTNSKALSGYEIADKESSNNFNFFGPMHRKRVSKSDQHSHFTGSSSTQNGYRKKQESQRFVKPHMRRWKIFAKNVHSPGFATPILTNTESDEDYGHVLSFSKLMSNFQKSHSSYHKLNGKNELFTETRPIRLKLGDVENQHPNFRESLLGHGYVHESEDQPKVSSMIPFTHPKLKKNRMHHANTVELQLQFGKLHQRKIPMHGFVSKNNELYLSFNKSLAAYEKYDDNSNKNPKHAQSVLSNTEGRNISHHRAFAEHFSISKNSNKKNSHLLWLDKLVSTNRSQNRSKGHRLYPAKPFPNYKNFLGRKIHRPWHFVSRFKANKIFMDGNDSRQKTNMSATAQEKPELLNDLYYHLNNLSSPHKNVTRELIHRISTHRIIYPKRGKATGPNLKSINLGKVHAKFRVLLTALSKDNTHNMSREDFAKKAWVNAAANDFYQNDKDDTTSDQPMIPVGYLWDYFKKFYTDDNQNEFEVADEPESYGKLETTDNDITSDEPNFHEYNGRYIINSFSDNARGINDETRYHRRKVENERLDPSTENEADDYSDEDYDSYDNNYQRYELPVSPYDDEVDNELL